MNYNYRHRKFLHHFKRNTGEFSKIFTDHEIKVLLIWSIVGPFCALAYLVWLRYPRIRWLSIVFFMLNMVYWVGQIGGWLYIMPKINILDIIF